MTASWATIVTATLAALAAAASWASVWQNRKQLRASLEPDLQIVIEGGRGSDRIGMNIRNVGGGTAKRIVFMATLGDRLQCVGSLGIGFLPTGYGAHVVFTCSGAHLEDGDVAIALLASDTREFGHAWSHLAQHHVFRSRFRRSPRVTSAREAFEKLYPDVPLADRVAVGFEWKQLPPGGLLELTAMGLHEPPPGDPTA